jgi:hypothetical protein
LNFRGTGTGSNGLPKRYSSGIVCRFPLSSSEINTTIPLPGGSFTFSSNCIAHPTSTGQAQIAKAIQQAPPPVVPPIQVVPPTGPSVATTPPTSAAAAPLLLVFPGGTQVYEPAQVQFTGDSSGYLDALAWSSWDASGASGSGTLHLDDCNPNCATGTFTAYPATVNLSGASQTQNGYVFTQMAIDSPTAPGGSQSFSIPR